VKKSFIDKLMTTRFFPYNACMFIRPCYKKTNGKKLAYWALVESYRTAKGPRQRIVAYLGQLKDSARRGIKQVAEGKDQRIVEGKNTPEPLHVEITRQVVLSTPPTSRPSRSRDL